MVLLLALGCMASTQLKAGDNVRSLLANTGSITYTLHIGNKVVTHHAALTSDSYIYTGEESDIVIADPADNFYIGIVSKGSTAKGKIYQCKEGGAQAYTLASYLLPGDGGKTMEAIPFDSGYVHVSKADSGCYEVSFMYSLKEKGTGRLITLKGTATFTGQQLAMQ